MSSVFCLKNFVLISKVTLNGGRNSFRLNFPLFFGGKLHRYLFFLIDPGRGHSLAMTARVRTSIETFFDLWRFFSDLEIPRTIERKL